MSYLVLARKWRPVGFDDVVGQEHVTATLKKAIEKNRVAHAYVFTGTRGVGKTTTARILARALNCEKGPTPQPCGKCESCMGVINGTSFDVLEIDGASNNSVEDVREMRDNVNYSSMGGKYRIYVIDEVHMLSKAAFNALLKTLEEPPKNVIFIFATTEPRKIPDTILSRCQRYDFRRISTERILAQLEKICLSEKITFDRQALLLIARKADGSMRDALSLLDQVYSFCRESITEKDVRSVLGLVENEIYTELMDAVAQKRADDVLKAVEEVLQKGYDLEEFLTGLEEYVRNLLFARIPGVFENPNRNQGAEITGQLIFQSQRFSEGDLLRMAEMLRKAESDLRWISYPRFLVEITLLKMAYMDNTISIERMLSALKGGDAEMQGSVPPAPPGSSKKPLPDVKKKSRAPLNVQFYSEDGRKAAAPGSQESRIRSDSAIERKDAERNSQPAGSPAIAVKAKAGAESEFLEAPSNESVNPEQPPAAAIAAAPSPAVSTAVSGPVDIISRPLDETPEAFDVVAEQAEKPKQIDPAVLWRDFISLLMHDRPSLGSFLSMAYAASVRDDTIDVRFPAEFGLQFTEVTRKQNRDLLHQKLASFAGRAIEMHISIEPCKKDNVRAEGEQNKEAVNTLPSLDDDMQQEPIIKSVINLFDGEVV